MEADEVSFFAGGSSAEIIPTRQVQLIDVLVVRLDELSFKVGVVFSGVATVRVSSPDVDRTLLLTRLLLGVDDVLPLLLLCFSSNAKDRTSVSRMI
jgi:hypothetical protein